MTRLTVFCKTSSQQAPHDIYTLFAYLPSDMRHAACDTTAKQTYRKE